MSLQGLQKLSGGLQGLGGSSPRPVSSTPAWPSTNLLVAYDFANALPSSGTLTSWPKTAGSGGATLTPTGTVTNGATGVTVSSSYVKDIGVTLGTAGATFTLYFVGSRVASSDIVLVSAGILAGNPTLISPYGTTFYFISASNVSLTAGSFSISGTFLARVRRTAAGIIKLRATGFAEVDLDAADQSALTYQLQTIGQRPWNGDGSAATATHRSLAAYAADTVAAGTSTAIEARINTVYGVTL